MLILFYAAMQKSQHAKQLADHTSRVTEAIQSVSQSLGAAKQSPIGQVGPWMVARSEAKRVRELLSIGPVDASTEVLYQKFFTDFQQADAERQLAEQIEQVVIMSATQEDLESWEAMERDFRRLFREQDISILKLSSQEIGEEFRVIVCEQAQ